MLHNEKISIHSLTFTNSMLQELTENLLNDGFRVFVFKKQEVSQIFFSEKTNSSNIGTCYNNFGMLSFGTVHKANKQCGGGFTIARDSLDTSPEFARSVCRTIAPAWWSGEIPKRWSSFEEKASRCSILTYYEVTL